MHKLEKIDSNNQAATVMKWGEANIWMLYSLSRSWCVLWAWWALITCLMSFCHIKTSFQLSSQKMFDTLSCWVSPTQHHASCCQQRGKCCACLMSNYKSFPTDIALWTITRRNFSDQIRRPNMILPALRRLCSNLSEAEKRFAIKSTRYVNVPRLRRLVRRYLIRKLGSRWIKGNRRNQNSVVSCRFNYSGFSECE